MISCSVMKNFSPQTPNNFAETKQANRSRKPSHAPSSTSTNTLSPDDPINQSPEDWAKAWVEFNAIFTRWLPPHMEHGTEFMPRAMLLSISSFSSISCILYKIISVIASQTRHNRFLCRGCIFYRPRGARRFIELYSVLTILLFWSIQTFFLPLVCRLILAVMKIDLMNRKQTKATMLMIKHQTLCSCVYSSRIPPVRPIIMAGIIHFIVNFISWLVCQVLAVRQSFWPIFLFISGSIERL